jgi:hypothetical protein
MSGAEVTVPGRGRATSYATVPVYEAFFRWLVWGDAIDPMVEAWRATVAERGDGLWPPPAPSPGDPEWMSRLVPMPLSAFEEPVRATPEVASLPSTFIRCARSDMGEEQAERAHRRGWRVTEIEATHFAPLTRPEVCAAALLEAASTYDARPAGLAGSVALVVGGVVVPFCHSR